LLTHYIPFINSDFFSYSSEDFDSVEGSKGGQFISSSEYQGLTMRGDFTVFGVNMADGRIKGYPTNAGGSEFPFFMLYVRDNTDYGKNTFIDNGNATISDSATGLTWTQQDSQIGLNWPDGINYCENLSLADQDDWRLPNAKELQSIVDYSRSPQTSNSAAIDPIFETSAISDEGGSINYPYFWSSTTHITAAGLTEGVYIAFGEALGWMANNSGSYELLDVHGAGAQRTDPKTGDPADYPNGRGPQGDVIRITNYVRCVR